jgi:hypothetical protein
MARPENGYVRDGVKIVSNTEALSMTRIRRWKGNPADWERRGKIGTAVHQATALLDLQGTTWEKAPREWLADYDAVDPEVKPMVLSWERFKREAKFTPRLIEHTFFTKVGITAFATTIDREGLLNGQPAIVEIKTPKAVEPYWGVQLAGQELAVLGNQGPPRERPYKYSLFVAQLFSSGTVHYKLIPYRDPADRDVFMWSLGIAVWNRNHWGS